jgi:uncharacterized lipoprotein NlpE involved in copper resistance
MKKKILKVAAVSMVLLMALVAFTACGSQSKYVGTWTAVKAEAYGVEMTMDELNMTFEVEFKDDGTCAATTDGQDDGEGDWEETSDGVKITDTTGQEITCTLNDDDQLEMVVSGVTFYLEKSN